MVGDVTHNCQTEGVWLDLPPSPNKKAFLWSLIRTPQLTFESEATRKAYSRETNSQNHQCTLWGSATGLQLQNSTVRRPQVIRSSTFVKVAWNMWRTNLNILKTCQLYLYKPQTRILPLSATKVTQNHQKFKPRTSNLIIISEICVDKVPKYL
jgi:hypothetical protein